MCLAGNPTVGVGSVQQDDVATEERIVQILCGAQAAMQAKQGVDHVRTPLPRHDALETAGFIGGVLISAHYNVRTSYWYAGREWRHFICISTLCEKMYDIVMLKLHQLDCFAVSNIEKNLV